MLRGACVSCCPAAELKSTEECVCLLPKQWPASCCWEEEEEEGVREDYFNRLNFFIKKKRGHRVVCLPSLGHYHIYAQRTICFPLFYFLPLLLPLQQQQQPSWFFFCQSSVLYQNCVAFCRRRRPDGICLSNMYFLGFVATKLTQAAGGRGLFARLC